MSPKKFDAQEWGRRLEAGDHNDPALQLAAQLQQNRPPARPLPVAAKAEIRQRLLRRRATLQLTQWAWSAVGTLVLVAAVLYFWSSLAQPEQLIQPGAAGAEIEPVTSPTPLAGEMAVTLESESVTTVILEPTGVAEAADPPTMEPPAMLIAADLWSSSAVGHPQVDARFALTLAEAQEQVAYPILAPTLLPASFQFVGAEVSAVYPGQPVEPGVGMILGPIAAAGQQTPLLFFQQNPLPAEMRDTPNFDTHEYEETGVTIQAVVLDDFSGDYQLDSRGGRATLRWQANGFRYTLTMAGELSPVEQLVEIAHSLQANSRWVAPPDQLWITAVSPEQGTILNEGDMISVTIGYELHSATEGMIFLLLVDSEWERNSAWLTGQPITAINGEVQLQFTVEDIPYLQAKAGQRPILQVIMSTDDAQKQYKELIVTSLEDSPWQLGETMIGIPRIRPEIELTILSEGPGAATYLDIIDISASAATAQGMTPITFTIEMAYSLSAQRAEEASVMIWIMPEWGGVTQVVAATAVAAGSGNITARFTFNPLRDLDANLRQPQRYLLRFTINKTDSSDRPELTAFTTPGEWTFEP